MATELLKTITDLLNEEKWTRATLNSYSITNFKDLDAAHRAGAQRRHREEIRELAGEHLKHTSNSIIALYLAGVLALSRELVDDTNLIMLISIFMDNHKWNIVEYLAERILEYGENKYALRTLGECYENRDEEPKKLEIWDRLIRVDYEEADIVKILGEKREAGGRPRRGGGLLQEGHPPLHQQEAVRQRQGAVGQAHPAQPRGHRLLLPHRGQDRPRPQRRAGRLPAGAR